MPPGLEEVVDIGPETDVMDSVMRDQRNSSVFPELVKAIAADAEEVVDAFREAQARKAEAGEAALPEEEWQLEARLLEGLPRVEVNRDLAQLLSNLLAATESGNPLV